LSSKKLKFLEGERKKFGFGKLGSQQLREMKEEEKEGEVKD